MIPVFQDKFVLTDGYGNCHNACVASILEIPLEEAGPDILPITKGNWHKQWRMWLAPRGYRSDLWCVGDEDMPKGYTITSIETDRIYPDTHRKAGERIWHGVVFLDGELIHDPFPGGSTIMRILRHETITKLTDEEIKIYQASPDTFVCSHSYFHECHICASYELQRDIAAK